MSVCWTHSLNPMWCSGNIIGSHPIAPGSTPGIGILFSLFWASYFFFHGANLHAFWKNNSDFEVKHSLISLRMLFLLTPFVFSILIYSHCGLCSKVEFCSWKNVSRVGFFSFRFFNLFSSFRWIGSGRKRKEQTIFWSEFAICIINEVGRVT